MDMTLCCVCCGTYLSEGEGQYCKKCADVNRVIESNQYDLDSRESNLQIVQCPKCHKYEYVDKLTWTKDRYVCRSCFSKYYKKTRGIPYTVRDLSGHVPTLTEYISQEGFI